MINANLEAPTDNYLTQFCPLVSVTCNSTLRIGWTLKNLFFGVLEIRDCQTGSLMLYSLLTTQYSHLGNNTIFYWHYFVNTIKCIWLTWWWWIKIAAFIWCTFSITNMLQLYNNCAFFNCWTPISFEMLKSGPQSTAFVSVKWSPKSIEAVP